LKRRLLADRLEIELTESAIMDRPDEAMAMLRELAGRACASRSTTSARGKAAWPTFSG
jgi:hypothetical protein